MGSALFGSLSPKWVRLRKKETELGVILSPWGCLLLLFVSLACQKQPSALIRAASESPGALAAAYAEALRSEDSALVYSLLSERARVQLSRENLIDALSKSSEEYAQLAEQLSSASLLVKAQATLYYGSETSFVLPLEGKQFVIPAEGLLPGAASTIEAALIQLTHALNIGSEDLVIAAHLPKKRLVYSAERASLLEALRHRDRAIVSRNGLMAIVELESGHRVVLSFEGGRWWVSEFH